MKHEKSVYQLRTAPLPVVRMGFIGLGARGQKTVERYADIAGAEIVCLADLSAEAVQRANRKLALTGRHLAREYAGQEAWREVCAQPDVDIIYICTDWATHATIAVEAMTHGKHVAVEVPLATTIDDCWRVVRTAEETQRHCFMTENCCYDWFHLATLSLVESGALGTITHCEGAYIHDWRHLTDSSGFQRSEDAHSDAQIALGANFYERSLLDGGNPYPTHAIGPIAQILGFHRYDRMVRLTSMTGQAAGHDSLLGHTNTALITTERGVTIMLQFDGSTPRPYSRLQTVCGTRGFVQKYPVATVQTEQGLRMDEHAETFMLRQLTSKVGRAWKEGHQLGVENEMNYAMDRRLIYCLQKGLPLDIDVYDAAEWSCLTELTRLSAQQGGMPVEIPNFLEP